MTDTPATPTEPLKELNKLFIKALRELADAGRADEACTYAGQAWAVLRHVSPAEAERHNGLLHYLTAPGKPAAGPPVKKG
ncbi:MAG: hypothetical protein IT448_00905 [Phycisphaerales bacterium]|nr:hypothetical protein [Phycisphaerales bacterium]